MKPACIDDSDKLGHLSSLGRHRCVAKDPNFLHLVSEDSDHSWWMPRVI